MQPLFQTSGWSLPTNIAADTKKKQKSGDDDTTTKDADQLQAQFNQLGPKKEKKKRDRQKGDSNSQVPAKKTKIDQEEKPSQQQQKQQQQQLKQQQFSQQQQQQPKQQPVQKKQDLVSQGKDHTTKKTQHTSSNDQQSKQQPASTNKSKKNKKKDDQAMPVGDASKPDKVNPSKEKKQMDANKKNKLKELLNKSKAQPQPVKKSAETTPVKKPAETTPVEPVKVATKPNTSEPGLTALQLKMKDKLSGARFRWLNEKLYTTEGNEAYTLFQEKPELFDEYHEGFRHQVESWPVNPVDLILEQLSKMPKGTVVADLGCGDAVIGHTLKKQKVLSYDLIAKNDKVIACDITKLPLSANAVDVVVFSLSLMGTNYLDFLKEAHRILKDGGEMKIAEVVSRFSDIDGFIDLVESLGFDFMEKDDDNKMFVMLYFTKRPELNMASDALDEEMMEGLTKNKRRALQKGAGVKNNINKLRKKSQVLLKPCLYKRR
ncbi:hypothetical protein [Absidia glauca]|uniref:Ribosomal RNA-processing protein 8 n=1 Tax=Absidia glauca TaxID=4829 RepID=A0A163J1M6_ABSGL|nr:hypothetical protein [Absidia glauca]